MAEVAASIIGISTFGIKLTLTLYEFSSTTSHAREEIDFVAKHVTLYANVLELLAERLEADEPLISEAALDLVEELYEQSDELFESIRKLLPRRDNQEDFSFLQRLTWNFKKTKVEKLVGTLEYLKSTVQLLVTVIFTGRKIRSYQKRRAKVGDEKSRQDRDAVNTQCLKAQTAIVEQVNTAQRLPDLQKQDDQADLLSIEAGQNISQDSSLALAVLAQQTGIISKFNSSVTSIKDTTQRRSYIMSNSTKLLHDLLLQWTTIDPASGDLPNVPQSVGETGYAVPDASDSVSQNSDLSKPPSYEQRQSFEQPPPGNPVLSDATRHSPQNPLTDPHSPSPITTSSTSQRLAEPASSPSQTREPLAEFSAVDWHSALQSLSIKDAVTAHTRSPHVQRNGKKTAPTTLASPGFPGLVESVSRTASPAGSSEKPLHDSARATQPYNKAKVPGIDPLPGSSRPHSTTGQRYRPPTYSSSDVSSHDEPPSSATTQPLGTQSRSVNEALTGHFPATNYSQRSDYSVDSLKEFALAPPPLPPPPSTYPVVLPEYDPPRTTDAMDQPTPPPLYYPNYSSPYYPATTSTDCLAESSELASAAASVIGSRRTRSRHSSKVPKTSSSKRPSTREPTPMVWKGLAAGLDAFGLNNTAKVFRKRAEADAETQNALKHKANRVRSRARSTRYDSDPSLIEYGAGPSRAYADYYIPSASLLNRGKPDPTLVEYGGYPPPPPPEPYTSSRFPPPPRRPNQADPGLIEYGDRPMYGNNYGI